MKLKSILLLAVSSWLLTGCNTIQKEEAPLPLVGSVDLSSFMGKWYVIASTPTLFDRKAYNAVEIYTYDEGQVSIAYQFNQNGFDGKLKTINSVGRIDNPGSNSDWNIRFFWPFRLDYKIIYLEPDYSITVIGHPSRNYAWIMARDSHIPDQKFSDIVFFLQENGFNIGKLRLIPHTSN